MNERSATGSAADRFPTRILGRPEVRELPPPPENTAQIIGPGIVAAGVGLASGEFILYPYIASQVGLVFVWAALVGVMTQFFLNMEIERYTLATGETALTGFSRFWRHWGLVFALMTYFANLWPGWATSSATMLSYLVGGEPRWIAIGMLVVIGLILTLAPVVYVALERMQMVKVAAVGLLILIAAIFVITAEAWSSLPQIVTARQHPGRAARLRASSWARSPSPVPAAGRTSARATGSATRASAWAATCRGSPARSPASPRRRRAPGYVFEPTPANLDALAALVALRQRRAAARPSC